MMNTDNNWRIMMTTRAATVTSPVRDGMLVEINHHPRIPVIASVAKQSRYTSYKLHVTSHFFSTETQTPFGSPEGGKERSCTEIFRSTSAALDCFTPFAMTGNLTSHVANRKSHIANRKSQIANRISHISNLKISNLKENVILPI